MAQRDYIDLLELQTRIKESMADAFPGRYWVKAEISSWSPRANGHCYLTLAQSRGGKSVAESRAMIWKWHLPQLQRFFEDATGQRLQAGITVLVRVQVSYSELYGISLFIDDIDPAFTLGEKALERKKAIEKLQREGYMDLQQELALPDIPQKLAIITSLTAAGYQDFRNHLLHNPEGYAFQLDVFEALMQGEQAPSSILEALQEAQEKDYHAVLLLRGGGSELDLSCYDDYSLAVGIATCPLPVITAIGHDKDVHIADLVAHTAVKTPTALADLFLDALRAQDALLDRLGSRVDNAVQNRLAAMLRQAENLHARIRLGVGEKIHALQRVADQMIHRIQFAAGAKHSAAYSEVALKEAIIKATDPRNILSLGYVLVTGPDHKMLKSVTRVEAGDRIGVRFQDGSLTAHVEEILGLKTPANPEAPDKTGLLEVG